jgi:N-succinyldiaminopimelate aminotransferase
MNPNLSLVQPYPFEKLRQLFRGVTPNPARHAINLSVGEPKHPTPEFIKQELADHLGGLASYPLTLGSEGLRGSIGAWLNQRHGLTGINIETQVVPTLGSREALFSLAQTIIDSRKPNPVVVCPNPFYQIYEGAALLAGAFPYFLNTTPENGFRMELARLPAEVWTRTQLLYTCSPGNPHGRVMTLDEWKALFALSDKYGVVIVSDECYSEIYFNETKPPLGALAAAQQLGRDDFKNLVVLGSLSKRSNVPGMRSGFAAGDAAIMKAFALYRTYHGSAMNPAVQAASAAAWGDEAHVEENRRLYAEKFKAFFDIVNPVMPLTMPEAAFYFWARTPIEDQEFTQKLLEQKNVTVLPGTYLAREAFGTNPGNNYVRIALVPALIECNEAANRIKEFITKL